MKYVKMLGLLAIAAAALMAFVASASATTLKSPTTATTAYTGTITAESEGATELHGSFVTVKCGKSHVEGKVEQHGTDITAGGKITTLSFTECNFKTTVLKPGKLEVHPINCNAGNNECTGTVTSSGAEVTIETSIANCLFTTSSTDVGTLTPSNDTSGHATLDINSAGIPRTGHSIFCGSAGTWTGSYTVTNPLTLYVFP